MTRKPYEGLLPGHQETPIVRQGVSYYEGWHFKAVISEEATCHGKTKWIRAKRRTVALNRRRARAN
jgi:hypothetical protein